MAEDIVGGMSNFWDFLNQPPTPGGNFGTGQNSGILMGGGGGGGGGTNTGTPPGAGGSSFSGSIDFDGVLGTGGGGGLSWPPNANGTSGRLPGVYFNGPNVISVGTDVYVNIGGVYFRMTNPPTGQFPPLPSSQSPILGPREPPFGGSQGNYFGHPDPLGFNPPGTRYISVPNGPTIPLAPGQPIPPGYSLVVTPNQVGGGTSVGAGRLGTGTSVTSPITQFPGNPVPYTGGPTGYFGPQAGPQFGILPFPGIYTLPTNQYGQIVYPSGNYPNPGQPPGPILGAIFGSGSGNNFGAGGLAGVTPSGGGSAIGGALVSGGQIPISSFGPGGAASLINQLGPQAALGPYGPFGGSFSGNTFVNPYFSGIPTPGITAPPFQGPNNPFPVFPGADPRLNVQQPYGNNPYAAFGGGGGMGGGGGYGTNAGYGGFSGGGHP